MAAAVRRRFQRTGRGGVEHRSQRPQLLRFHARRNLAGVFRRIGPGCADAVEPFVEKIAVS
jgi:hypothetical protein